MINLDDRENMADIPPRKKRKALISKKSGLLWGGVVIGGLLAAFLYAQFIYFVDGIQETRVPNIVSMEEDEAVAVLREFKLEGYLIGKRFSNEVSMNRVVVTNPEVGSRVKVGRKVGYILSLGLDSEKVPDFRGKTIEQVMEILKDKPCQMQKAGEIYSAEYDEGRIVSQNPKVGEQFQENTVIRLWFSKGYPVRITLSPVGPESPKVLAKIDLRVIDPVNRTQVKIISIHGEDREILYDEAVVPGKELYFEIEQIVGSRLEIYFNNELAAAQDLLL
jgi:hypothetical protein